MWDPPRPGLEPMSLALAGRFLTTVPPGKPSAATLTSSFLSKEETSSGDLDRKEGPKPKLKSRNCANKEEKGKSLPAASGAAD